MKTRQLPASWHANPLPPPRHVGGVVLKKRPGHNPVTSKLKPKKVGIQWPGRDNIPATGLGNKTLCTIFTPPMDASGVSEPE